MTNSAMPTSAHTSPMAIAPEAAASAATSWVGSFFVADMIVVFCFLLRPTKKCGWPIVVGSSPSQHVLQDLLLVLFAGHGHKGRVHPTGFLKVSVTHQLSRGLCHGTPSRCMHQPHARVSILRAKAALVRRFFQETTDLCLVNGLSSFKVQGNERQDKHGSYHVCSRVDSLHSGSFLFTLGNGKKILRHKQKKKTYNHHTTMNYSKPTLAGAAALVTTTVVALAWYFDCLPANPFAAKDDDADAAKED